MAVLPRSSTAATGPAQLLLMALLACATAAGAEVDWICYTGTCGKGSCSPLRGPPPLPFSYQCDCDPGWSQAISAVPYSPCTIPNCSFDSACLNVSLTPPKEPPLKICPIVNCGAGGACKQGDGDFQYSCECQPGYVNLLNNTSFPCVKNCNFGKDCSALGVSDPPPSPPPPPPGVNQEPSAPPSGTTGSVPSQSLLQLLLLVSVAMIQVV